MPRLATTEPTSDEEFEIPAFPNFSVLHCPGQEETLVPIFHHQLQVSWIESYEHGGTGGLFGGENGEEGGWRLDQVIR